MAGRTLHKLTAKTVEKLAKPGRHSDGGGLYLSIDGARRRWVFIYRDRRTGKLRELGLGSARDVTLAEAREKAGAARGALAAGRDPADEARADKEILTFEKLTEEVLARREGGWRNEAHRKQWRTTLEVYAAPINALPVNAITVDDVVRVLEPIWLKIPATAKRLRGRIEAILDAARAKRMLTGENPARWRGNLDHLLAQQPKSTRHHAAMPFGDVHQLIGRLRETDSSANRCLEFMILTATRSGEAIGACWSEIDLDAKVWTIPAERMKAGQEHAVPLSDRCMEILAEMKPLKDKGGIVFHGRPLGKMLSDAALRHVLKAYGVADFTVHGFRSSFRDWAGECTSCPRDVAEMALAHIVGNKTEQAYRRARAFERRRMLMQDWASFIEPNKESHVVPLRKSVGKT